mgnify:FL=1
MKALVTKPCSINGTPVKAGDSVEVDANTFANLSRKGWLKEQSEEAPKENQKPKAPKP